MSQISENHVYVYHKKFILSLAVEKWDLKTNPAGIYLLKTYQKKHYNKVWNKVKNKDTNGVVFHTLF